MHLKFEKKIHHMLVTTTMFMFLFFFAVAPDVMKHEGSNWSNAGQNRGPACFERTKRRAEDESGGSKTCYPSCVFARVQPYRGDDIPNFVAKAMEIAAHDSDRGKGMKIIMPPDPNAPPPEGGSGSS